MATYLVTYHSAFDVENHFEPVGISPNLALARRIAYRTAHQQTGMVVKYEDLNGYLDADTLFSYAALGPTGYVAAVVCVVEVNTLQDDGQGYRGLDAEAAYMAGVEEGAEQGEAVETAAAPSSSPTSILDTGLLEEGGGEGSSSSDGDMDQEGEGQDLEEPSNDIADDDEPSYDVEVPDEEDIPLESEETQQS